MTKVKFPLLERYRYRRKQDRLYLPPPKWGFKTFLKNKLTETGLIPTQKTIYPKVRLDIMLNRYCNLNCFSCTALGMNPSKDETTFEEIEAFVINMEGYHPGITFLLTGGEPTAIDHGKLEKICDLIHDHGYKTAILTNGFKLVPVEWFDYVLLDRHGINDDDIAKWIKHLEQADHENYEVLETLWHMDLPYSIKDNITKGARCGAWMNSISLWKDVIYLCCNLMHVSAWDGDIDQKLAFNLREAGWTAYNPDLAETIKNWRETLPGDAYRMCTVKCWKGSSKTNWVKL